MQQLGQQLAHEFGRGVEVQNPRRMVQFGQAFADAEIVVTLSRQLSWSHFVALITVKAVAARSYYARQCASERWSVRELRRQIERQRYERSELAGQPVLPPEAAMPAPIFKDPLPA